MINLKDYRQDKHKYMKGAEDKGHAIDWPLFNQLDMSVRELKHKIDELNAKRNELSTSIQTMEKGSASFLEVVQQVKSMKGELETLEQAYTSKYDTFHAMLLSIPSPALDEVPIGTEADNQVIKLVGDKPTFDFEPKTHWELLEAKGYLDSERGVKLSGSRFVIVKGKLAELQLALTQWATQKLVKKGFELALVPQLVREEAMTTTGFLPNDANNLYKINPLLDKNTTIKDRKEFLNIQRSKLEKLNGVIEEFEKEGTISNDELRSLGVDYFPDDFEKIDISMLNYTKKRAESQIDSLSKTINDWEEDDLWLIGTSEVPLIGQHVGETFAAEELPKRYVGYSSCYRREAGTYGKDTKGLIRLHQFEKVEMVSFVRPQDAAKEHEMLFAIENELFSELGLHYQQILIATGDLGAPAAKKYDIEAWFPGIGAYKEVTSTSNTTDFQTRRGGIKYKEGTEKDFVYSLNGTAVALGRALACIVETYQTPEGDIRVPEVLQPWMSSEVI